MMMQRFTSIVSMITLAALVSACGGGGSSAPSASGVVPSGSTGSTGTPNTGSGKTTPLTVTVHIPPSSTPASLRRSPTFVDTHTTQMSVTTAPGGVSGSGTCTFPCSSISATVQAPLNTTAITVLLKDSTNHVLSSALNYPVTIQVGTANNLSLTFDGVVAAFAVSGAPSSFFYTTAAAGIPITVTPLDAHGSAIVGPGNLVDSSGTILVPSAGPNTTVSLTATDSTFSMGALVWNSGTYTFSSTLSYSGAAPSLGTNSSGSVVVNVGATSSADDRTFTGTDFTVTPALYLTDAAGTPGATYRLTLDQSYSITNAAYDVEVPQGTVLVNLALSATFIGANQPVTVTNDTCTSGTPPFITSTLDSLSLTASPGSVPATVDLTSVGSGFGACTFVLTDSNATPNTATVNLAVENPQIIVSGKARK
jgi:hypothetical protein